MAHYRFARCGGAEVTVRAMGRLRAMRPLDPRLLGIVVIVAARRFRVLVVGCELGLVRGMTANVLVAVLVPVFPGPIVRVVGMRLPGGRAIMGMALRSLAVRVIG